MGPESAESLSHTYRVVRTNVETNYKGRDTTFLPSQKNHWVAINLMSKDNGRPAVKTRDLEKDCKSN